MKPIAFSAGLTAFLFVTFCLTKAPVAAQQWLILSIGSLAICAATVVIHLLDEPSIPWRISLPRLLLLSGAVLASLPFAAIAIGFLALTAVFMLPLLPMFALAWRGHHETQDTAPAAPRPRHSGFDHSVGRLARA